jgi:hypothetical protein
MKSVLALMLAVVIVAIIPYSYSAEVADNQEKSCIFNYIACKDNCEYYQDSDKLKNCKNHCDTKYSCRPKLKQQHDEDNRY